MDNKNKFDWVPFYHELANRLLAYKDNRKELVKKVYQIFEITKMNMPTLEKDNELVDIDPFTFFGLFNKTSMRKSNRIKIIQAVADLLSVNAAIPTSFDSIPVLNQQNATFYGFIPGRGDRDIDDLWELFDAAIKYANTLSDDDKVSVSKWFDVVINKKGNGNSKVTMGLYWIAPDTYLNLDSRNKWYIYESQKIPKAVVNELPKFKGKISASKYFEISDIIRNYIQSETSALKDFKELSYEAWKYSEEINKQRRENEKREPEPRSVHYWVYSPGDNAAYWDEFYDAGIMAIGWDSIGDLSTYSEKDDMKRKMQEYIDPSRSFTQGANITWQFANGIQTGDIIFAKKGIHQIIGRGEVISGYRFDAGREHFKNVRQVEWTDKGEWPYPGQAPQKTLTDMTPYTEYVDKLNALFENDEGGDKEPRAVQYPAYGEEDFLNDVFMDRESYKTLVGLVNNKMNVVLQGAPGVGKTYAAKLLAYSMIGEKNPERVMMVQFHQSYSYEDFIMGYRPSESGFELRNGVFYSFCKKAEEDSRDNKYFFIIDEINRGNLSKIFGELFMLVENDKRDEQIQLLYQNEKFSIPGNVYIIGTMNTADRSLAMLDYALRRRFAFFDMKTALESEGFCQYESSFNDDNFDSLIECVENLNSAIISDESLGEGFCIGHSYFCNLAEDTDMDQALSSIVEYELIPLLKEYWFDEPDKVQEWSENLRSAIK